MEDQGNTEAQLHLWGAYVTHAAQALHDPVSAHRRMSHDQFYQGSMLAFEASPLERALESLGRPSMYISIYISMFS